MRILQKLQFVSSIPACIEPPASTARTHGPKPLKRLPAKIVQSLSLPTLKLRVPAIWSACNWNAITMLVARWMSSIHRNATRSHLNDPNAISFQTRQPRWSLRTTIVSLSNNRLEEWINTLDLTFSLTLLHEPNLIVDFPFDDDWKCFYVPDLWLNWINFFLSNLFFLRVLFEMSKNDLNRFNSESDSREKAIERGSSSDLNRIWMNLTDLCYWRSSNSNNQLLLCK